MGILAMSPSGLEKKDNEESITALLALRRAEEGGWWREDLRRVSIFTPHVDLNERPHSLSRVPSTLLPKTMSSNSVASLAKDAQSLKKATRNTKLVSSAVSIIPKFAQKGTFWKRRGMKLRAPSGNGPAIFR